MSDTPRTDKLFGGFAATDDGYWKVLDHARQLERELAALRSDNLTAHKMACAAGIERDTLRAELVRLRQVGNAVVERWETPLWKDVEPTAHIIYALRDELAAQQKSTNETNTTQTSF